MVFPFLTLALSLALVSAASTINTQSVLCQNNQIELEIKEHQVVVDGMLRFTSRVYFYNNQPMVPGPTIRMKAGTYCKIKIINNLPNHQSFGCSEHHSKVMNYPHCADVTNLHTHGLHIPFEQDNVKDHILPGGGSRVYTYNVPEFHLMGTFWYFYF